MNGQRSVIIASARGQAAAGPEARSADDYPTKVTTPTWMGEARENLQWLGAGLLALPLAAAIALVNAADRMRPARPRGR